MSNFDQRIARSRQRLVGSIIDSSTSLLAKQQHDIVRFAMGSPDEELIPVGVFDECFQDTIRGRYDYGASEGEARLIRQILRVAESAGEPSNPDRLVITTGAGQGLDLAFRTLIEPGDLIIVEGPTYTNIIGTALSYGAELLEAPTDQDGLIVEALPQLVRQAGRKPAAIYVIPNFQNPSGTTLSSARRELLLDLAEEWDCAIIDDDPYGLLRFSGDPIPSLSAISPGNPRVFGVRTLSKVFAPGLRLGWIDTDPRIRELAVNARQTTDTCASVPVQHAVAKFLEAGGLDKHISRLLPVYRERKEVMRSALAESFGGDITATSPDGGFFLWVSFTGRYAGIDTSSLFKRALQEGVAYIPGQSFSTSGNFRNSLRLCFATSPNDRIVEGIDRLKRSVEMELMSMESLEERATAR